jgi:hypothetical protein
MKMEQTECSDMLAFKLQMPVNHPEESIQHSEHGETLKSRLQYMLNNENSEDITLSTRNHNVT